MNQIIATVRMELLSDTIISSGNSIPGGADITLRTDRLGRPYFPGSTLKGLFRDALVNYFSWTGTGTQADLDDLLGKKGVRKQESGRRLHFSDLHLDANTVSRSDISYLRTFTALENGVARNGSLHTAFCLRQGLIMTGVIQCSRQDLTLLETVLRLIQRIGLKRNRGFGHVRFTVTCTEAVRPFCPVPEGHWIRYRLRLETPMAISQGVSSPEDADRKQFTDTHTYIPGSAIRGMVISYLAQTDPEWFSTHKDALLRQTIFRNALPLEDDHVQIPVPMGFYESRKDHSCYSILEQEVRSGDKRARLKRYCHRKDGKTHAATPSTESILRIDIDSRLMFTTKAMSAGTCLEGYIHLPDPSLAPRVCEAFRTCIWIGADRHAGSGLCRPMLLDGAAPDQTAFGYGESDHIPCTLYLLLLSPTALTAQGTPCGLSDSILTQLLDVEKAEVVRCATALIAASGFNRTWGCASDTVIMYSPGSIFKILCSHAPSRDRLAKLELEGIGIRRSEGCGQVLFLRDFGSISDFAQNDSSYITTSPEILFRRARANWLLNTPFSLRLSPSQIGTIQSMCEDVLSGSKTVGQVRSYLKNKINQSTHKNDDHGYLLKILDNIVNTPLSKTLNLDYVPNDSEHERLRLLCDLIDLSRKKGG